MINDNDSIVLFKFGECKYIDLLISGIVSFGCPALFIYCAQLYNNNEQGDINEAVFARLRKSSAEIERFSRLLGNDLEKIDDGAYVKLRRKSSLYTPVFCAYSLQAKDLKQYAEPREGAQKIRYDFDDRMHSSFAESLVNKKITTEQNVFCHAILNPRLFLTQVFGACHKKKLSHRFKTVDYDERAKEEFLFEPTDSREELFHKDPSYSYQKEIRIILQSERALHFRDRYNLNIGPILHANKVFGVPTYLEVEASLIRNDKVLVPLKQTVNPPLDYLKCGSYTQFFTV